jgi:hypothetical protein
MDKQSNNTPHALPHRHTSYPHKALELMEHGVLELAAHHDAQPDILLVPAQQPRAGFRCVLSALAGRGHHSSLSSQQTT